MTRSYYSAYITNFLNEETSRILSKLTINHAFDLKEQQRDAWLKIIEICKKELTNFTSGYVIFEYSIPRMGKRADVILVLNGLVFVMEFKINEKQYKNHDINQCYDYVLDLKYFHEQSYNIKIIPVPCC